MLPKLPTLKEVSKYLSTMDQSRVYSNFGPLVEQLEIRYANFFNVERGRVVSFANATLALQGAIQVSMIPRWVVPNYTFPATAHAVLQANRDLVLVDVKPKDWKLNTPLIPENDLVGLLPVAPFGSPIDINEYKSHENVVFDAAASLGAEQIEFANMQPGHFVVFSLHATKVLGAGEGAIVVCGDAERANQIRSWSNFGFENSRDSRFVSTNAKMSEVSAAYGLASLDNHDREKNEWLSNLLFVKELMAKSKYRTIVDSYPGFRPYWIIAAENEEERLSIQSALDRTGVMSRTWWPKPLSSMKAFQTYFTSDSSEVSDHLSKTHLGLPMYRDLTKEAIERIVETIHSL